MALDDKNPKKRIPSMPMPEKKGGNEQLDYEAEFPGGADDYDASDMADDAADHELPESMDLSAHSDEDLLAEKKKRNLLQGRM